MNLDTPRRARTDRARDRTSSERTHRSSFFVNDMAGARDDDDDDATMR